jgi:aminoglycoside phosphotransferase (APT) family kinase protein
MADPLDIERPGELEAYLRANGRIAPSELVSVRRLAGGVSNRVMLLERTSGESWVVKQALPKLRVAVDWFSDPRRIGREALGLKYLAEMLEEDAVPRLIFLDEAAHVLAMSAIRQPHENWKTMLMRGEVNLDLVGQWGRLLGRMHRVGWERREELSALFDERAHFESLRVEAYYEYTATRVAPAQGFIEQLVDGMRQRRWTVVHGDWSPKNVLVRGATNDDRRLVLLDHEVIHFGDPGFDLGFSLTHLLSKGHHLKEKRDAFGAAAKAYWREYRAELGAVPWIGESEDLAVRHTLACLLARVAGRSVLEYLTAEQKNRQREVVVELMRHLPRPVDKLVDEIFERV